MSHGPVWCLPLAMSVVPLWCTSVACAQFGGDTIRVCDNFFGCDFETIQEAVDSVSPGDDAVIEVLYDDHREREIVIDVDARIEIIGNDCILSAWSDERLFDVRNGDVHILNLSITGGGGIDGNPGVSQGGAIRVGDGAILTLQSCIIIGNRAQESGGGVHVQPEGSAYFYRCVFRDNQAIDSNGGGLYIGGINYQTNVDGCVFDGNVAGANGGGLYMGRDAYQGIPVDFYPQLRNCAFARNTAGRYGGGAFVLSALSGDPCVEEVLPVGYVTNCTFKDNTAAFEGAIYGNQNASCESASVETPSVWVLNSIIWDNGPAYTSEHPTQFFRCTIDVLDIINASPFCDQCTFACSDTNPRFVFGGVQDNGFKEFRVWPGSPVIDRGFINTPYGEVEPGPLDLAGNPRRVDSIFGDSDLDLDLGSNEFTPQVVSELGLALWTNGSVPSRLSDESNWYAGLMPERSNARTTVFDGQFNVYLQSSEVLDWWQLAVGSGNFEFLPESDGTIQLQLPWVVGFLGGDAVTVELAPGVTIQAPWHLINRGDTYLNGATLVATQSVVELSQQVLPGTTGGSVGTLHGPGIIRTEDFTVPTYLLRNNGQLVVSDEIRIEDGGYLQSSIGTMLFPIRDGFGGEEPNRVLAVEGAVDLAGAAIFDIHPDQDLDVGSQFPIIQTGGGFNGPSDGFDLVVTQWPETSRFIVVEQVAGLRNGGFDSMVGTVLSLEELFASQESLDVAGNRLSDMLLVDIDGDGARDLVLSVDRGATQDGAIVVLLNQGGGTAWQGFSAYSSATLFPVGKEPRGLDSGTIYGTATKGLADIAVTNQGDGTVSLLRNLSTPGSVLFVEQDVLDLAAESPGGVNPNPVDLTLGNYDEDVDGYQDLVVTCLNSTIWTFPNPNGSGSLLSGDWTAYDKQTVPRPVTRLIPGSDGGGGKKDTRPPVGTTKDGDSVESGRSTIGVGPGGLTIDWTSYLLPTGSTPEDLVRIDLDGDTLPDIVTSNSAGDSISILFGNSSGDYNDAVAIPFDTGYSSPESVAGGDIDGDGDNDLAVVCLVENDSDGDGTVDGFERVVRVIRNMLVESGSPGLVFEPQESYRGSDPYQVRIEDLNGDGAGQMVVLTSSSGSPFLPGSVFGFGASSLDVRSCPADLNDDGHVSGADIGFLLGSWGPCTIGCIADLDRNGIVDSADLNRLLGAWGPCSAGAD